MRVAMIKQTLDVFGPWASMKWDDSNPKKTFQIWPGKATLWEMTALLKADWYIIPAQVIGDYHLDLTEKNPQAREVLSKYVKVTLAPEQIPYHNYDIVITLDPILRNMPNLDTVFAYFLNEHWDVRYKRSLRRPSDHYDLFLAHMMDGPNEIVTLPQAVSFPYMRAPEIMRSIFNAPKEEVVWVDWRTLTTLAMTDLWSEAAEQAVQRLQNVLNMPIRHAGEFGRCGYGISDPPRWGDAESYLDHLSRCKYYISVGQVPGAGQGLCDAASLGSICFGQQANVYHRIVAHPDCLCADMVELPIKFRRVVASPDLQKEVLNWQDRALKEHFVARPLSILEQALELKRKRGNLAKVSY